MALFKHNHSLPELPATHGGPGTTCPAVLPEGLSEGRICGERLAYAHNMREYHSVRSWSASGLVIGEANEYDLAEDEDPHLWCANGHDWAVPQAVEVD